MEISFDQLPQAVAQIHDKLNKIEALLERKETLPDQEPDQLLTVKDAAAFLSLSVPTVYTLISKGELPVMKRSKRCYFSKLELINYLKQGRRKTNEEIAIEAEERVKSKSR